MLGDGRPVGNGAIDLGDGRLLFLDVKQVLDGKCTVDLR